VPEESEAESRITCRSTTVIQGLRPAKLDENESRPLRVFNGLAYVFDPGLMSRRLSWLISGIVLFATMPKAFSCASTSSVSQSPTAKANKFLCATSENNMCARISGAYPLHKLSQIKPVRWMYGQRFEQDAPGPHVASCPIYSARAQAVTLASRVFMTSKIMCTTASSPIAVLIIV